MSTNVRNVVFLMLYLTLVTSFEITFTVPFDIYNLNPAYKVVYKVEYKVKLITADIPFFVFT